jgi:hypothetical protein
MYVKNIYLLKCGYISCYIQLGAMVKTLPLNLEVRGSNPYFRNLSTLI